MAKRLLLVVTVFFFILALSHARTPLDLPGNDVAVSDLARTIILPSEKPETVAAIESEKTETNKFEPLTVINFRPVNRHFPRRPSLTLRHRFFFHQHRFGKPWGPARFPHPEIVYSNDKIHHRDMAEPRFPYWRGNDAARGEDFNRLHRFHRHHHHRRHHMEADKEARQGPEHEGGFFVKIRKFLNDFY